MLGMCVLLILLWLLILVSFSLQSMGSPRKVEPPIEILSEARGYGYGYSPVTTYPVVPFFEPLVILSVIAFIAYVIQMFHTSYLAYRQMANTAVHSSSLLGGVVDNLIPTRHRTFTLPDDRINDILTAIRLYDMMSNKKRKRRPYRNKQQPNDSTRDL